jgi:pimeloyl-ACP methyl ester carboxylesterase
VPAPSDDTFDVRGTKFRAFGGGEGPPLLFLHGAGGGEWMPFMDMLAADFRVIAPDHPGFGVSDSPEWLDNPADLACFYLDYLDASGLERVHLVGSSLGGWIAAEIACRNSARLASLTLVSSAGLHVSGAEIGDIFIWNREEIAENLFFDRAFSEAFLARPMDDAAFDIVLKNRLTSARLLWAPRLHDPHLGKWLHRISVPTLILWGANDKIISADHAPGFASKIPNATVEIIPECGHLPFIEKADRFVSAFKRFVAAAS